MGEWDRYFMDAERLMDKYRTDTAHVRHVAALSETLFRELAPVHGLPEQDLLELQLAALLHDIGHAVGERDHHIHSCYLIRNDEQLDGWDNGIRERVACASLHHRKKKRLEPDRENGSPAETAKRLSLAGLLRMADVLDYEHRQSVKIHEVRIVPSERLAILELSGLDLIPLQSKIIKKFSWAVENWGIGFILACGHDKLAISIDAP